MEHDDTRLRLRVGDSGCGIDEADLPHVFESFRQAARTTGRTQRGLGLGLAITRHIVDAHQGTIQANSAGRGRGATFTVELPYHQKVSLRPPAATEDQERVRASIAGLSFLCVDDDEATLEVLQVTLDARGAVVHTARSVSQALAALKEVGPDVIVTDIVMADRDGYDLLAAARSLPPPIASLPIIATTAHARLDAADRAAMAAFDGHLTKPLDFEALVRLVCTLVPSE